MKPGVYQMSFRGLTLAEAWRFGKEPFKFTIALILKAIAFKGSKMWLPTHDCEAPCDESQLSLGAQTFLVPEVRKAQALGYVTGGYQTITKNLDPHTKEGFGYLALHRDRMRSMFIGFIVSDASGTRQTSVVATGGLSNAEHDEIEFVNHGNYMDGTRTSRKIRVKGQSLEDLDRAMQDFISRSPSAIRQFSSLAEFKAHAARMSDQAFDARIARGLYVYVGDGN